MKQATKVNVDTTQPKEEDMDWCRDFLYPDLRAAYMLQPNPSGYKHALDLCAKIRRATLDEVSAADKRMLDSIDALERQVKDAFPVKQHLHKYDETVGRTSASPKGPFSQLLSRLRPEKW